MFSLPEIGKEFEPANPALVVGSEESIPLLPNVRSSEESQGTYCRCSSKLVWPWGGMPQLEDRR